MKKLIIFAFIATAFAVLFTGCGNNHANNVQSQNNCEAAEQKIVDLENQLKARPTRTEILTELDVQKKNSQRIVDSLQVSKINLGPIDQFIDWKRIDVLYIKNYVQDDQFENIFYSYHHGAVKGETVFLFEKEVQNPAILKWLLDNNKITLPAVLQNLGLFSTTQFWANKLLPYFNGTASQNYIKQFDAFFAKYGHEEYGIPRDNEEWQKMQKELRLSDTDLENEYKMYLFAKRRKMHGGNELMKVCTEVLTFLKDMKPSFKEMT